MCLTLYKKAAESENYIVNRDMRHQNVVKFSEELKVIDWEMLSINKMSKKPTVFFIKS